MDPSQPRWSGGRKPLVVGAICGVAAFLATWLTYRWLNPQLEARTDWLRELQGFLFTTIPAATAAAALLGWYLAKRISSP